MYSARQSPFLHRRSRCWELLLKPRAPVRRQPFSTNPPTVFAGVWVVERTSHSLTKRRNYGFDAHFRVECADDHRPLVGIHIHGLKGPDGKTSSRGANPFSSVYLKGGAYWIPALICMIWSGVRALVCTRTSPTTSTPGSPTPRSEPDRGGTQARLPIIVKALTE